MRAPIGACIIAVNETDSLIRCLESIRPYVNQIVVGVDRNCALETYYIAKEYADTLEEWNGALDETGKLVDFAAQRQRTLDLVLEPWAMWIDADDELQGGDRLHEVITSVGLGNDPVQIYCPYLYSKFGSGEVREAVFRERLVFRPQDFSWKWPAHEVLVPKFPDRTRSVVDDRLVWRHESPTNEAPSWQRNLRIIKYHAAKGKLDSRLQYYLALETLNSGNARSARTLFDQFLGMSPDDDKRQLALIQQVHICISLQELEQAHRYADQAVQECRSMESYAALAKTHYFTALQSDRVPDWELCAYFARTALALGTTPSLFTVDISPLVFDIHAFLNYALFKLGDLTGALQSTIEALKIRHDPHIIQNRLLYEGLLAEKG